MFEKSPKSYTDLLGKTNRIVEGSTIKGDIVSSADFRLDGHLVGNFQSKGKIVIGHEGSITGDVICRNADIEGKYDGKIQVQETLNVKSKASIHGEVTCGKLSVEPGADFSASCIMKPHVKGIVNDGKSTEEGSNKWLALINIPIQMGVIIFIFAYFGNWLDKKVANNFSAFTIIFSLLGVFISLYNVIRQVKDLNKNNNVKDL